MKIAAKLLIVCASVFLLAGCSAPIKSRAYAVGEPVEGIRYSLSKTTVSVVISARLKSCGATPVVELLEPEISTATSADASAQFVINPRDSLNWFREINVPSLTLSTDGRLAKVEASVVDQTPATLLAIAKSVNASSKAIRTSMAEFRLGGVEQPKPSGSVVGPCSEEAVVLVNLRDSLANEIALLQERERALLLNVEKYDQYTPNRIAARQSAQTEMRSLYEQVLDKLRVSQKIDLDVNGDSVPAALDLAYRWFPKSEALGCGAGVDVNKFSSTPQRPLCLRAFARLASIKATSAISQLDGSRAYDGLLYRIPAVGTVTVEATVSSDMSRSVLLTREPFVDAVLPSENTWLETAKSSGFSLALSAKRPVLQFGVLGKMPSDVGLLTSNEIKTEFDIKGVPNSLSWKAQALPIASVLGLPAQIYGLRTPASAPLSDVARAQQELISQLIQSCKDALSSGVAVPSYCVNVLK